MTVNYDPNSGSPVNPVDVYGEVGDDASVCNNTVNILNGTVREWVIGGLSDSGDAYANTVSISGGSIGKDVYGGLPRQGSSDGNVVAISGGAITGNICGGHNNSGINLNHSANGNGVTLSGQSVFGPGTEIWGGLAVGAGEKNAFQGNTLRIYSPINSPLAKVANFQHYEFFLPATAGSATPMLTAGGIDLTGFSSATALSPINTPLTSDMRILGLAPGGRVPRVGDSFVLLRANPITGAFSLPDAPAALTATKGFVLQYDFIIEQEGNELRATPVSMRINPRLKAFSEGRAAAHALLSQGALSSAGREWTRP